jgi:hypothetical protein
MEILITNEHNGQFGNKVLHYHNAYQLSKYYNCELSINDNIKSFDYFNIDTFKNGILEGSKFDSVNPEKLKDKGYEYFGDNDYLILDPCLGDMFFEFDYESLNMLPIKEEFEFMESSDYTEIGLHFRGTDFHTWNPVAILDKSYYIDSIIYCLSKYDSCRFKLFTDDLRLESYNKSIEYLKNNNINYRLGSINKNLIYDFEELSNTDVIVSTPSTFAICAGFLKKKKDIIHNKKWIDSRTECDDHFWVKLSKGGNKNYKIKKLI